MVNIGLVDCDTSHVVAFTQRLNHIGIGQEHWVEGGRVVAVVPGRSEVWPDRIPGHVETLRGYGVAILERPEELLAPVNGHPIDAVMIESVDSGVHLERSLPFIEAGLPLFVDKPFAPTLAEARQLVEAAQRRGVPLLSASALRYCPEVLEVQARAEELGPVLGVDAYTPAPLHRRNPGLLHYGVHGVETVYALMGTGCRSVRCVFADEAEVVVGRWRDGRLGTVRGTRRGSYAMGFVCFCEKGVAPAQVVIGRLYRDLLVEVVAMFRSGRSPLSAEELLEPIAFQEAALRSKEGGGEEVMLPSL
jgi:predicted dehydrogenase